MKYLLILIGATRSITANKLRTALTVLGVLIGIAAVSLLVSLGAGLQQAIDSEVTSLGTNLITVLPGPTARSGAFAGSLSTLTLADAQAIGQVHGVAATAPYLAVSGAVEAQGRSMVIVLNATTSAFAKAMPLNVEAGKFSVQPGHMVLDISYARTLFGGAQQALGKTIAVDGIPLVVSGVIQPSGGLFGDRPSTYVPLGIGQRIAHTNAISEIFFTVSQASQASRLEAQVNQLLLTRHHGVKDFHLLTDKQILKGVAKITTILTAALSGIAGISLLVGGVGIMNIMWVTVTERTSEVGLRKALGATNADILLQFLYEATLVGLAGGLAGLAVAIIGTRILGQLVGIAVPLTGGAIALALGTAACTGLVFGVAPAWRAARLEPMAALRHE